MTDLTEFQRLIGKAIEEAAKDLPDGYQIVIEISQSGTNVFLRSAGKRQLLESGDGMIADIEDGLRLAKHMELRH